MTDAPNSASAEPDRLAAARTLLAKAQSAPCSANDIADGLRQNRVTVRANLRAYADSFRYTPGPRGRHDYSYDMVRRYVIFNVLRDDELRMTANEAITVIRSADLDVLWEYIQGPLAPLLRHVRSPFLNARPDAA